MVIGIDEVGRGCWAGPLLVVAVRATAKLPSGLADSKTITVTKREMLFHEITDTCAVGEGWVEVDEIDRIGLAGAMRLGVRRALMALNANPLEPVILDGNINYCPAEFIHAECIIRADAQYPIVSAASIYAKVRRDKRMAELARDFPAYGFDRHVGYGTALHRSNLLKYGPSAIHRRSYRPIKAMLGEA